MLEIVVKYSTWFITCGSVLSGANIRIRPAPETRVRTSRHTRVSASSVLLAGGRRSAGLAGGRDCWVGGTGLCVMCE